MYVRLRLILALAVAGPLLAQSGEIAGRVRITKALTRKRISIPQVYERSVALPASEAGDPGQGDELARVVVFLEGKAVRGPAMNVVMDQRRRRFEPEVVVVPLGSTVEFPNSDPVFHNVFSLSKGKTFDLGNYPQGQRRTVRFDQPGPVLLNCHLHPNMTGAVLVAPNRHYARPDGTGRFSLPDVPPGSYELVAWHKSAGMFKRRVEVRAGGRTELDLEIPLTELASR